MRAGCARSSTRPTGALLVTGPTGSGKSTTLYAALTEINRPEINIITVEDPVEYRLAGMNQVQINPRAGLTFASALRSILRSDPDVVMVGEIRDGETAKISIEAALTGHLVLSTLHTNDAPSAITRLNEMGVEPFLTGSAVSAVLAQRLARKLCSHCCEMYSPSAEELLKARVPPDIAASRRRSRASIARSAARAATRPATRDGSASSSCCDERGDRALAAAKARRDEIERAALAVGMRSLWDDGLAKVARGSPRSKSSRASSRPRALSPVRFGSVAAGRMGRRIYVTWQPRYCSASTVSCTKRNASGALAKRYGPRQTG